jgi:drug/metabolite transporter (DMT)-like permease
MSAQASAPRHASAILMLVLANVFWGLSFPLIKAIAYEHQHLLPGSSSWFITACMLVPRFVLAAAIMAMWQPGALRGASRLEIRQGVGLALFAVFGMIFQNDGLQYTSASTSAFLTQIYAILIPLWLAVRGRRLPPATVWISCALVLAGVAVLARFDWRDLHLGRGEIETLVSSLFFMGQILMLDRPDFAANRPVPVTLIMFIVEAVASLVLVAVTASHLAQIPVLLVSIPWLGFTAALTVFCTVGAFTIMNTWQPRITATEAGLIYCLEPLAASCLALFLPGLFAQWAGIAYPNETMTTNLLVGGGLITAANLLIQLKPLPKA